MASIKAHESQSILDLAIQQLGSVEAVFNFAAENDLSLTQELIPGQELTLTDIENTAIANYYSNMNLKPATGLSSNDKTVATENEGIGYWAINVDFVIQ